MFSHLSANHNIQIGKVETIDFPVKNAKATESKHIPVLRLNTQIIDEILVYLVCVGLLSFQIVDNLLFQLFVRLLNPLYRVPTQ